MLVLTKDLVLSFYHDKNQVLKVLAQSRRMQGIPTMFTTFVSLLFQGIFTTGNRYVFQNSKKIRTDFGFVSFHHLPGVSKETKHVVMSSITRD